MLADTGWKFPSNTRTKSPGAVEPACRRRRRLLALLTLRLAVPLTLRAPGIAAASAAPRAACSAHHEGALFVAS